MRDIFKDEAPKDIMLVESVLDINGTNIWTLDEHQIASLWERERKEENFTTCEEKLLNTFRIAFEVCHYDDSNPREVARYENGEWAKFVHCNPEKGAVAIRKKTIKRITDLSYENVKHISAGVLLDLIDKNFGGGWDSISLQIRDIIETGFDISTTQLPASRIHAAGGTVERKVAQGFDVLEIPKGSWVEAIFAKKKDPVEKYHFETPSPRYDEDGNPLPQENEPLDETEVEEVEVQDDDTFYSSYASEAEVKEEDEEGFPIEE